MRLYQNWTLLTLIIVVMLLIYLVVQPSVDNSITGRATTETRVQVIPTPPTNCSGYLYTGWNLISVPCYGSFVPRNDALESIEGKYLMIFEHEANDAADPWKSYNPSLPNWTVQQLNNLDRFSGYWIYMTNDSDFNFSGVNSSSNLTLYPGWNLVGYPTRAGSRAVNTSLNGISFTIVRTYNNPTDTWLIYVNGSSNNTLTNLTPFEGYWINASSQQSWSVT